MALSKNALAKAVKKFKPLLDEGKSIDDIQIIISTDEEGFEADEITQIIEVLSITPAPGNGANKGDEQAPDKNLPGAGEKPAYDLAEIDYKNLKGDMFKKYVSIVGDRSYQPIDETTGKPTPVVGMLRQDEQKDFELYRVKPIMKERFPGMEGSPKDFVGLEIVRDTPEHVTRIPVSVALEFNAQILNAHSIAGHGKYYLLKK